ncbi:hypothetical protein HDK64DRAFT_320062 [Phyllosticta capitalensis]
MDVFQPEGLSRVSRSRDQIPTAANAINTHIQTMIEESIPTAQQSEQGIRNNEQQATEAVEADAEVQPLTTIAARAEQMNKVQLELALRAESQSAFDKLKQELEQTCLDSYNKMRNSLVETAKKHERARNEFWNNKNNELQQREDAIIAAREQLDNDEVDFVKKQQELNIERNGYKKRLDDEHNERMTEVDQEIENKNKSYKQTLDNNHKKQQQELESAYNKRGLDLENEYRQNAAELRDNNQTFRKELEEKYYNKHRKTKKNLRASMAQILEEVMRARIHNELEQSYGNTIRQLQDRLQASRTIDDVTSRLDGFTQTMKTLAEQCLRNITKLIGFNGQQVLQHATTIESDIKNMKSLLEGLSNNKTQDMHNEGQRTRNDVGEKQTSFAFFKSRDGQIIKNQQKGLTRIQDDLSNSRDSLEETTTQLQNNTQKSKSANGRILALGQEVDNSTRMANNYKNNVQDANACVEDKVKDIDLHQGNATRFKEQLTESDNKVKSLTNKLSLAETNANNLQDSLDNNQVDESVQLGVDKALRQLESDNKTLEQQAKRRTEDNGEISPRHRKMQKKSLGDVEMVNNPYKTNSSA